MMNVEQEVREEDDWSESWVRKFWVVVVLVLFALGLYHWVFFPIATILALMVSLADDGGIGEGLDT